MSEESKPAVGYGRPPSANQFKPGQSGNPKGRPKGAKNSSTVLQLELDTKIRIRENGKPRSITKREAILKRAVNDAISGNPKAVPWVMSEDRRHQDREAEIQSRAPADDSISETDKSIMEALKKRLRLASLHTTPTQAPARTEPAEPVDNHDGTKIDEADQ